MNNSVIINSISNSITYKTYRNTIQNLLKEEKSTGNEQSETLLAYSLLNDKRMNRLDKTISITKETQEITSKLLKQITLLVIAEGWCGDAAQIVPVLHKIAETSSNIDLKIVLRDENEDLMNLYLTNGAKSIPKVIILNETNSEINTWGPRPSIASKMVMDYKQKHGALDADFKKDLQIWYNKDKGLNIQSDFIELFKTI